MGSRPSLFSPNVSQYLLDLEEEQIVEEIVKHPICMVYPAALVITGVIVILISPSGGPFWALVCLLGFVISCVGLWKYHALNMDRFVVTNMRVFRVHGVLKRDIATIPLMRILDITVHQTLTGMIFNYGHLTFESAASQGMRKITFVANPKSRDLIIQGVIHRSGVRRAASAVVVADGT